MEASAHVNSLAARARILRALPGQLTAAKLADPAASLAAVRALDAFCLTAADAIDAHDAASRADRDAIDESSEALDRFVAHVERACEPRGGGDLASKAAAATLLGRCARDCAPRRFVTSLARWGERLQGLVKPDKSSDATVAAVAAARAMCEILRRAGAMMDVPGVRKEAATVVQRALPSILAWLDDEESGPAAAAASLEFIKAALVGHPAALRPRADALERSLVRAVYSRDADTAVRDAAAGCVAASPRIGSAPAANAGGAPADSARAWSSTCRRALIAVHANLDVALEGAEPMNAGASSKAKLMPAGEEPPPPLGFDAATSIDGANGRPSSPVALRRAIAMLRVIAAMLRAALPTAASAPVPAELILATARRTLDCDGAGAASAPGLPAIALRVETLAALPDAHVAAADVVVALVECGGVAMTALAGPVARLVDSCLRRGDGSGRRKEGGGGGGWGTCAGVRVAMYAVAAAAARRMGAGAVAGDLAAAVVPAAARDAVLGWDGSGAPGTSSSSAAAAAARRASKTATTDGKKRKKGKGGAWGTAGAAEMEEYIASGGLIDQRGGVAGGGFAAATAATRAAALECLEAVLTSAGAALKPSVRTLADAAAAEAACAAVATATAPPSSPAFLEASTPAQLAVRSAAYDALLASVLAPRPFRPTNLALASALFRRARTFDPALARVAGRAMLCLEAVVHPAAPPLHPRAIAPPRELLYGGGGGVGGGGGDDGGGWDGGVGGGAGREISWGDGPSWGDEKGADEEPPAKARKVDREDEEDDGEDEEMAEEEEEEEAGEEEEEGAEEEDEHEEKPAAEPDPAAEPEPAVAPAAEPVSPTSPTRRSRRLSGGAAAPAEPPALDPAPAAAKKKAKAAAKRKTVAERKAEVDAGKAEVAEPTVRPSLGSGKAAVQVQLSDSDSDGELPEIVDDFE